jgi:hypothetical protein
MKKHFILVIILCFIIHEISYAQNHTVGTYDIENSKGLIIAKPDNLTSQLIIYNIDGNVWKTFAFKGQFKRNLTQLAPYVKADIEDDGNLLLVFKCVRDTNGYHEVVINEKNGQSKYIKIDDKLFKFITWSDFITTKVIAVDFDYNKNPIRTNPALTAKRIAYDKDEIYIPIKTNGDWLQVKWGNRHNLKYGWVQWRTNHFLIIELFYKD